jgi:hypothetical protein
MSYPESLKSSLHLVHTTIGDLVELRALEDQPLSGAGVPLDLREGEVVRCLRNDSHGVLVARRDGTRILVPLTGARGIRVRWFSGLHDSGERSAGRGAALERSR